MPVHGGKLAARTLKQAGVEVILRKLPAEAAAPFQRPDDLGGVVYPIPSIDPDRAQVSRDIPRGPSRHAQA